MFTPRRVRVRARGSSMGADSGTVPKVPTLRFTRVWLQRSQGEATSRSRGSGGTGNPTHPRPNFLVMLHSQRTGSGAES